MDLKQLVVLALQVSIVCTVFGYGLKATAQVLPYLVQRPGLLLRSLLAMFVVMPVVAILLARLFDFRPTVKVVLIALAISPVPPLLPGKQSKAGGEQAYGLGLMATLGVLSIGFIPLVMHLLASAFDRPLGMAPGAVARAVLISVLIPLVAGIAVRTVLPGIADRLAKPVGMIATLLLIVAGLALLAGTWRDIGAAVGDGTVVAIVAFATAGLLVGHVLGGPEPEHSVVLALSTASRHPAIALAIAAANYPDERFGGTILLYLIVNVIVGLPYLAWQRGRMATSMSPA